MDLVSGVRKVYYWTSKIFRVCITFTVAEPADGFERGFSANRSVSTRTPTKVIVVQLYPSETIPSEVAHRIGYVSKKHEWSPWCRTTEFARMVDLRIARTFTRRNIPRKLCLKLHWSYVEFHSFMLCTVGLALKFIAEKTKQSTVFLPDKMLYRPLVIHQNGTTDKWSPKDTLGQMYGTSRSKARLFLAFECDVSSDLSQSREKVETYTVKLP